MKETDVMDFLEKLNALDGDSGMDQFGQEDMFVETLVDQELEMVMNEGIQDDLFEVEEDKTLDELIGRTEEIELEFTEEENEEENVEENVEEVSTEDKGEIVTMELEMMNKTENNQVATEEVTVIGKGTKINGSISTEGSIEIYGEIEGDIDCLGKLSVNGVVKGNSTASEVYINAKRLEGNVTSDGNIKIGQGTVVVGDINATAGVIAGAVKGQIDINGAVVLDSTAIVKGNIKAKSVQINNGAVVDGYCSLSYAAVDIDDVFND